jgi:hypothetical protein
MARRGFGVVRGSVLAVAMMLVSVSDLIARQKPSKPQAAMPLCSGQKTTNVTLTPPATAVFGPDENKKLAVGITRATAVVIPAGRTATFTFSADAPEDENAVIIYDSEFKQLAERGTAPEKGFEPFRFPETAQAVDTTIIVSTWVKHFGKWNQSFFRVDAPKAETPFWTIRAEEAAIISGDYRDMIVTIGCE